MSLVVHGCVGRLDADATDGRRIARAGFSIRELPIPLMRLTHDGPGHAGAEPAGRLATVSVEDDGRVLVAGYVEDTVAPGGYACGMDASNVTSVLLDAQTGLPLTDATIGAVHDGTAEWPDVLSVIERCTLIAVTMYGPDMATRPAFPEARLTVEAGA